MEYVKGIIILAVLVGIAYSFVWLFKALGRGAVKATYRVTHSDEKRISDELLNNGIIIMFAGRYQDFYERLTIQERIVEEGKLLFAEEGRFESYSRPGENGIWTVGLLLGGDAVGLGLFTPSENKPEVHFRILKAHTVTGVIVGVEHWIGFIERAKALGQQMISQSRGHRDSQEISQMNSSPLPEVSSAAEPIQSSSPASSAAAPAGFISPNQGNAPGGEQYSVSQSSPGHMPPPPPASTALPGFVSPNQPPIPPRHS
ncbi:MAG: hypothetical protein Q4P66_03425 [Actinomycetaceae bacterium]|nr:hypothetical protein [Actinomycetaceae bacterium]